MLHSVTVPSRPDAKTAFLRGFRRRCPNCGEGRLFAGFLTLVPACAGCGEVLGDIRTDDIPAYFTILIVGHIIVPLLLWAENFDPPSWVELSIIIPLTLLLTALLLPSVKGACAARLWSLNMRGGTPG